MLHFDAYEVLTFDCYGTLIDWEQGILAAVRPVLEAHGVSVGDDAILECYAGLESAAEQGPFRPYKAILQQVMQGFGERWQFVPSQHALQSLAASVAHWPPFPDTVAALEKLSQRYRLAIISNIDENLFAQSARHLQVSFDWIITAERTRSYKPALHNFQVALEHIGRPKTSILHVAQSLYHDIAPASQLGLSTVWVNRRHGQTGTGATPVAQATPDLEVPDLASLVSLMGLD